MCSPEAWSARGAGLQPNPATSPSLADYPRSGWRAVVRPAPLAGAVAGALLLGSVVLGGAISTGSTGPAAPGGADPAPEGAGVGRAGAFAALEAAGGTSSPPPAPLRVALQAGHWKAAEAPDELRGLRDNGGASGGGKAEWEVNLEIARLAAALLEEAGYAVDILPATVPEAYRGDAFVAIHADGNNDSSVRGFRVGWPRRDATRRASEFAEVLAEAYGEATGIRRLPVATRRMRGYYAFRHTRYRHAIHPSTVGVIIETGFLTSPRDREVIVADPGRAARGIFEGVARFLGPATAEVLAPPVPVTRPSAVQ